MRLLIQIRCITVFARRLKAGADTLDRECSHDLKELVTSIIITVVNTLMAGVVINVEIAN